MLYDEQKIIYDQIKNGYLLPLETGTGKTIIALYYYFKNYSEYPLLIIAPAVKVKEGGWDREIKVVSNHFRFTVPRYTVISYDKAKKLNLKEKYFLIIDEAHYIKNSTSGRSKCINKLIKNNSIDFLLLTATPGSKVEDHVHYFMLWGFIKNKFHFYKKYMIERINPYLGIKEVVGYQNMEDFKIRLKLKSTDVLRYRDMAYVPVLKIEDIYFKTNSQYKKIKKTRVIELNGELIPLDTQPHLCSKLRQYCNITDKIEYLKLLVETMSPDDNILIFYNFESELNNITQNIKVDYLINGNQANFPKKEEFDLQKGKVTLVQIKAGGAGIELQYNNLVVFYSPTYSYQDYCQALGRAYRTGQTKKVQVFKFNTLNSIEEDIWKNLDMKQNFVEELWKG
ncbi:helicase-related protein [Pseudostreptobacillus hongkongensis]|uniref:helicase-related protein n=1 Tax=Pseudostreptobacillus hongkongensis TaxID=1162717 RepID=UPI00082D2133|nr:helicase-related protein [Pseudostreptobacillus hongkongensis]